jgi:hypothetical protein
LYAVGLSRSVLAFSLLVANMDFAEFFMRKFNDYRWELVIVVLSRILCMQSYKHRVLNRRLIIVSVFYMVQIKLKMVLYGQRGL